MAKQQRGLAGHLKGRSERGVGRGYHQDVTNSCRIISPASIPLIRNNPIPVAAAAGCEKGRRTFDGAEIATTVPAVRSLRQRLQVPHNCGKTRVLDMVRQPVTRQKTTQTNGENATTLSALIDPDQNLFQGWVWRPDGQTPCVAMGLKRTNSNSPHSISVGAVGAGLQPAAGIT
ncbi:hypothetical protein C4K26_5303 [Pseudomonas chlororaphis]|nr:hypothetical protein C4K26_5303 [Pseudomonas chlororaphis]